MNTCHGHHIEGTPHETDVPNIRVIDCGGFGFCVICDMDAERHVKSQQVEGLVG